MRRFWVLVCGVLLSVQGFAAGGRVIAGTTVGAALQQLGGNQQRIAKTLLSNPQFIETVADLNGILPTEVTAFNLHDLVLTEGVALMLNALADGQQVDDAAALRDQTALANLKSRLASGLGVGYNAVKAVVVGGALVLALSAGNASAADSVEKRAKSIDKKMSSAKVIEFGNGLELDGSGKFSGAFADYNGSSKPDSVTGAIDAEGRLRYQLSELTLRGSIKSTHTKDVGAEDWNGAEDYGIRGTVSQGISIASDYVTPIVYADAGAGFFGSNKRQVDATGGIGANITGSLFGKKLELQVRGGFGWLGEGMYDGDDYGDIEGDTVASFGGTLKTGWVSLGDALRANEGSLLYYVPFIPNANTSYFEYRPVGDGEFDDVTRRLESTINVMQGLGVTVDWNKTAGQEAHKAVLLSLTFGLF